MKSYADFTDGMEFTTRGRTLTESHIASFSGLSGDFHPLHTDADYCRDTPFGQPIAHGPLVYSVALGLVSQTNVFGEAIIAFLGAERVRHLEPCFAGTTLHVKVTILETRPTSDGRRGVVSARYEARNGDDVPVMVADVSFLAHGPPSEETAVTATDAATGND
jgi:acyl dehydratase